MIECCCSEVDGCNVTLTDELRRARKEYQCCECGCLISVGDRHHYYFGTTDGDSFSARTCAPCAGIRRDFFPCGGYFGEMREDFRECMGFDYLEVPDAA